MREVCEQFLDRALAKNVYKMPSNGLRSLITKCRIDAAKNLTKTYET